MFLFSVRKQFQFITLGLSYFLVSILYANAQQFIDERVENFVYEVKIVDEFIDRFNNTENTLITKYSTIHLNRQQAIKYLFNKNNSQWDTLLIQQFIQQVINSNTELNFYDKFWYAQLRCQFIYQGIRREALLTLENQIFISGASKWLIVGIYAPFLDTEHCADDLQVPRPLDKSRTLNPMTHATNFVGLKRALADVNNIRNYYCQSCNSDELDFFALELCNGSLKLASIDQIVYHFLEVDNWIFTVEYIYGKTFNSGWLISTLKKASQTEKKMYKMSKLFLN